jgi:hypothetical protein
MFNNTIINYTYILEKRVCNFININNVENVICLCYHICKDSKYPYIQFILEKDNIKHELNLPSFFGSMASKGLELKINKNNIEYLGIIENTFIISNQAILLVNILNTQVIHEENNNLFITIPTEIVNYKHVSNIPINESVVDLFTKNFHNLCVLYDNNQKNIYPLPEILYSPNEYNLCKLEYLLNRFKININNQGSFLCFYREYSNIKNNSCFNNNNKQYGINRYVAFIENYICIQEKDTNINISKLLLVYNTILIQNNKTLKETEYDTIIRDYDNIYPIGIVRVYA